MWKIEKIVSKGDYNYALVKGHPKATKNGYVLEHRVVMENHLGRLLISGEVVHHINGRKKDNRLKNLQLMSVKDHASLHGREQGAAMLELKCPSCGKIFVRRKNVTHAANGRGRFATCSNRCRGKFSRKIQLTGQTTEVELAISENIVREFNSRDNPEQTVKQQDA